ncbi:MAG: hypothetical protein QXN67_07475 [Thermoproteota archaeon]
MGKITLLTLLVLVQVPHVHPDLSLLLRYDDGGAECFWSDYYPNGIAVEFTPPALKWRITAVLIYGFAVVKGEKSFIVEVRDSGFNAVFRASFLISNHFKNATLDWARVPLPNIVMEGNFYVCIYPMLEPKGTQLWIAIDNDTISNRSFLVDCYKREMRKFDEGNVMIRVEGKEATDFIEIIPDYILIGREALRLLFKVITTSNITEVRAILQIESLREDCEVIYREGLYEVMIDWSRLFGLREPAMLMLSARASNSTAFLTMKLSETLVSTHFRLRDENALLRAMFNSSKAEMEVLKDRLENREASIVALRSLLDAYEEKLLNEAERNERLCRELNVLRLLIALLAITTIFLLVITLRRRSFSGLTSGDDERVGGRCLGKH